VKRDEDSSLGARTFKVIINRSHRRVAGGINDAVCHSFLNFKEMKKKIVTYGVRGMIEYQALIKLGQVSFKVTFEGGSMTELGVVPATFTTKNFLVQQAIEMSPQYKKGLIKKEKELETDEDLEVAPAAPAGAGMKNEELKIKADDGLVKVEVTDADAAKSYLAEHFGVQRSKLKSVGKIKEEAAAQGVEFVGI
jgi:hypothetical protein